MFWSKKYKVHEVFGISTDILEPSYVDRGDLDAKIQENLDKNTHIALRGESKCGKSWLRKKNIPTAIAIQCRLGRTVQDIYIDALSQIGIKLSLEKTEASSVKGRVEATQEVGASILAKIGFRQELTADRSFQEKTTVVGHDISDLRYIADIIVASGRRLVIEDFHYLSPEQRRVFAYDLKALWDYKTYVIIIGIWSENNLLLHLNPDLSGRVEEIPIIWRNDDLSKVIERGSDALKIIIDDNVKRRLIADAFGTVGILQKLVDLFLSECRIKETQGSTIHLSDCGAFEAAAMQYADQLNAIYQTFAKRVSSGIRKRTMSTGIYAHMLATVLTAKDDSLKNGMPLSDIYDDAHKKEPRIQKGNLRSVLKKIDSLQVDEEGRGLIITYDENKEELSVVDRQLLLYRKYATIRWPWEEIIESVETGETGYDSDSDEAA